ncbi:ependymin-like [Stegastes partitus]|uniref:Ependymin-like n=1 Tax=Stegastes partitus TaxID=144197 RepID=A0A3B4ZQA7_9TELE|nr:PREDICTED: ependymin-like [Stegastes partitus]
MRLLLVLACFLAACLANPHPCYTPPLLTGALTLSTQNEELWVFAKYLYDGIGQRLRVFELVNYKNQSLTVDLLLLYREAAAYDIKDRNHTCAKYPLKQHFQPWHVPKDATLLGPAILGSSSGPGEGLLVNTWMGDLPDKTGKYIATVTEFGCIPVSTSYQTKEYGWVVTSLFDNVKGITNPSLLDPPDFCTNAVTSEEPVDFISLLHKNTR